MTPERWQKINEIFQLALEMNPAERSRRLAEICAGDAKLYEEVQSLLLAHQKSTHFIAGSALENALQLLVAEKVIASEETVGNYRLIKEIGRGGMGSVFLAAPNDANSEQVAIKLIQKEWDSRFVRKRLRSESHILANLNHPNIARLLDSGTTPAGQPFIVMEYIKGQPIDTFADAWRLTIKERLKLFRQICNAVHYSHQHHVIHRDIKPGNILVTDEGALKLLDFGIAKLLEPESSDPSSKEITTVTMMRIMTPEYASPEQVRGEFLTPASDIYSLGVLLYELLTGHLPYQFKSRSLVDVYQVLMSAQPEKPSSIIERTGEITSGGKVWKTVTPELVSYARRTSIEDLQCSLEGSLDDIVLKAMHNEPQRRYALAEGLSEDIHSYLASQTSGKNRLDNSTFVLDVKSLGLSNSDTSTDKAKKPK